MPTLTMSYNYTFSDKQQGVRGATSVLLGGDNASRQTMNFNISYPLFNGFTARDADASNSMWRCATPRRRPRDARLAARANLTSLAAPAAERASAGAGAAAAIAAAEEDLRVQQQRYALGASTLLDLLTSQTTLNQARQALIQARFDGRVARAQLASLLGPAS